MIDLNRPPVIARELAVAADSYPYPIAIACRRLLDSYPDDPWEEWERLSRDLLGSVLPFLSHLLLSDLVASGRKDAGLFPLIRDVLSRPLAGQYVRFLRETARVIDPSAGSSQVPDLVRFLQRSEVESTLLDNGRPLLGTLVDYRNQWAHHGRLLDAGTRDAAVEEIRTLSAQLLRELRFLADWHLVTEEGEQLMGSLLAGKASPGGSLLVEAEGGLIVRPLLLRLDGDDLVLLEEFDERRPRLQYRGSNRVTRLSRRELTKGKGQEILEELKVLLGRVRALDESLPRPSRNDFIERVKVKTDGTLRHYEEARKYLPSLYIERPEWDGPGGIFDRFLDGGESLLAISGPPGTGKSALCARLAERTRELGHIPLLINAQRLSFTSTEWSANPLPAWFADILAYEQPLDREGFRTLAKTLQSDEQVVVFVDALNEVEGIQQNWNRFVAMERMLEWIVDVAQPRIRFVLTFRLDAYEDFGFLKPNDLPPGLEAIAVSGTRPDKPWLMELESFSFEQARAFYERLQAQPQLGMAPDLDWESLATSLGDRLGTYTRNPLLFGIFLKIHHGSTEVRSKDPEELFDAYAARVTGEEALRLQPWWRRAVGFVRNANITPKQRFILDAVDLMTRNGSPSVVAERLAPRGTRAERRILSALSDGRQGVVDELREAGILVLERIEESHPSESVQTQRLGFVAELLTVQLDRLKTRIEQRELAALSVALTFLAILAIGGFMAGIAVAGSSVHRQFFGLLAVLDG